MKMGFGTSEQGPCQEQPKRLDFRFSLDKAYSQKFNSMGSCGICLDCLGEVVSSPSSQCPDLSNSIIYHRFRDREPEAFSSTCGVRQTDNGSCGDIFICFPQYLSFTTHSLVECVLSFLSLSPLRAPLSSEPVRLLCPCLFRRVEC